MSSERQARLSGQLRLIERRFPLLARHVAAARPGDLSIEPARSGAPTLYLVESGRPLALHSAYDPQREADQFVASQLRNPADAYALIGFGLGYQAEALLRRLTPSSVLLVFEPCPAILRVALEQRDLAELLERDNVFWFTDEPDSQLLEALLPMSERLAEGLHVLVPPASNRRAPEYAERVRKLLSDVVSYGGMALTTKVTQSRRAISNLIGNLGRYAVAESLVHWKDRWRGYPALVVSAGPSLARNRSQLTGAKGKALFVVVGTALKQVLAVGVQPELVLHIDHSDLCTRHFEGIENPGRTILLAEPTASPIVLAAWPGRLALLRHAFAEHLLGSAAPPMPQLPSGMTVAHTAFYAAEFCGADPIIFVGQDLAFTDGLYYSPGNGLHELWQGELNRFCTVETKEWERLVRRKSQLTTIPGVDGHPLLADRQMLHYLRQFERDFARSSATVIDATEGGARKAGTHVMSLRQALERHLKEDFPVAWTEPDRTGPIAADEAIRRALEGARRRMAEFQQTANEIVKRQQRALGALPQSGTAFTNDMSTLQHKVQSQYRVEFQIAAAFDGALELEKQRQTRRIESAGLSETERLRQSIERDLAYVDGLSRAAGAILELLEGTTQPRRLSL